MEQNDRGQRHHSGHDHPHHRRDGHHERGHHGRGRRDGRLLDYGDLRLLVLAILAEQPCHGYELMRVLEERTGGRYVPSPGVIYPTLAWLDDMGYATIEVQGGGRKSYRLTPEGEAFRTANLGLIEALLARLTAADSGRHGESAAVTRGMENLKLALRLRLRSGPLDPATADTIAAALDAAAQAVERA